MDMFMAYAQAREGDFTVGRNKLNEFCSVLAGNYKSGVIDIDTLNDKEYQDKIANSIGFDFDSLLSEEIEYCINLLEGMIMN